MSKPFSAVEVRDTVQERGFYAIDDDKLGQRMSMNHSFALKTVGGFNFCKTNLLEDTVR